MSWWADTGIMEARDIEISKGENRASEEDDLGWNEYVKVMFDSGRTLFGRSPAS